MNYLKNLSTERIFKIHIVWRVIGLLIYWSAYPYDTSSLLGQSMGILLATFVLINFQNENFYVKWIWYIFTAFSTGIFYLYLLQEKIPYFYLISLPVYLTQILSVYKIYQEDRYL